MHNPYQQYQNVSVAGKNQLELMLMLYDGAINFLRQAQAHIHSGNIEPAHNDLIKAKRIVMHLISTLDPERVPPEGKDLVSNLLRLYVFCYERITTANLKKDGAEAAAAIGVLQKLREGWAQLRASGTYSPATAPPVIDQPTIDLAEA